MTAVGFIAALQLDQPLPPLSLLFTGLGLGEYFLSCNHQGLEVLCWRLWRPLRGQLELDSQLLSTLEFEQRDSAQGPAADLHHVFAGYGGRR